MTVADVIAPPRDHFLVFKKINLKLMTMYSRTRIVLVLVVAPLVIATLFTLSSVLAYKNKPKERLVFGSFIRYGSTQHVGKWPTPPEFSEFHSYRLNKPKPSVKLLGNNERLLSLMHIPKTGLTTFHDSMLALEDLKIRYSLRTHQQERCLRNLMEHPGHEYMGTFFRNPLKQIYSQYLECKYDAWGKWVTNSTGFPRVEEDEANGYMPGFEAWLRHFVSQIDQPVQFDKPLDNFNCYHPFNLQTRYLYCDINASSWSPKDPDSNDVFAHYFFPDSQLRRYNHRSIQQIISGFWFIGLLEFYDLSACMYRYQITGKVPPDCDCSKQNDPEVISQNSKSGIERHSVPPHSISVLNQTIIELMKKLSRDDAVTYAYARLEFFARIQVIQDTTGVRLWCSSDEMK